jgi:SAM-dependent methyltransferase
VSEEAKQEVVELKLDLGCGKTKPEAGFIGVDIEKHEHVQVVTDLRQPWPWDDNSVDTVFSGQLLCYFDPAERIHFVNELYRVLKPLATARLITPHWCSARAYSDLDMKAPPIAEPWFYYLNKSWRESHAYWAKDYRCHFEFTLGYTLHPSLINRATGYQEHAVMFDKEAAQDIIVTLTKQQEKS